VIAHHKMNGEKQNEGGPSLFVCISRA
jgi:hypothetical protein